MLSCIGKDISAPMEPLLSNALNSGFEVGDVVYGSLCIATCCALRYMLGENLESLEQFMRSSYTVDCAIWAKTR